MDKSKIIKIVIIAIVSILAIIYYFLSNQKSNAYEDIFVQNVVTENKVEEQNIEEKIVKIKVYVAGEVNMPGVIELEEGARIEDAIQNAGGVKPEADLKNINLAYEVSDGEKIYIPNISEADSQEETITSANASSNLSSSSKSGGKININKATEAELVSIPGIGTSTAQKIVAYREENGKFQAIEDIKKVSGIGNSKYESIKDYISVK